MLNVSVINFVLLIYLLFLTQTALPIEVTHTDQPEIHNIHKKNGVKEEYINSNTLSILHSWKEKQNK